MTQFQLQLNSPIKSVVSHDFMLALSQKLLFTVISETLGGGYFSFVVCAAVRLSFRSDLCSFDFRLVDQAHLMLTKTIG